MSEETGFSGGAPGGGPVGDGESRSPGKGATEFVSASEPREGRGEPWEREVLAKLAMAGIAEQRRARRWNVFFRFVYLGFAGLFVAMALGWLDSGDGPVHTGKHTALVELKGVIASEGNASAELIVDSLRAAFEDDGTAGVILRINSPGGSPVQSGIIHDEILRLRKQYPGTPIHAVVEEICASGGYYVAVAADQIYVDKASMIGSIGVLMEGFGFVDAMRKLGVERRLLTAGENKAFLDSFSPLSDQHRAHAQKLLDEVHQQFIEVVRKGRGNRLKESPDTFSGLVWTGAKAVELGLADSQSNLDTVARDVIKAERIVDFSRKENIAERLAKRLGASAGEAVARYWFAAESAARLR